ncbi:MAG: pilus assembly protein [Sphingomonadaceae bacterium]
MEFGVIAPVFLVLMMGVLDIGHMIYGQSVLNGAVEAAARGSALETANTAVADAEVADQVGPVLPGVTVTSTRTSYFDFADIGRAEPWNDVDSNGQCNDGEVYTDQNSNGQWDEDIGVAGNGGANDVVIYEVSATYEPIFRIPFMPEEWESRTLKASTVRKNQPFAAQTDYSEEAGSCD